MKPNAIIERFDTDDRGVSPVIGVILMVAITVILAAVIGTFVLDLGQSAGNSAPSASLTVDVEGDNVTIAHKGGDSLDASQTRVTVSNDSKEDAFAADDVGVLSVGDEAVIDLSTSDDHTWAGATWNNSTTSESFSGLDSGTQLDVEVIDTESQRVIFETTVTA